MKKLYFFLVVFCFVGNANAQVINFTDSVFKAKLLTASTSNSIALIHVFPPVGGQFYIPVKIDTNNNGEIEESEAAVIYSLNVSNSNITSLQGIEYFTGLAGLNCSYNHLPSLVLGATGSLENSQLDVNCSNNQLTSIDHTGFIGPLFLYCQNNQLTSLDFSDFSAGLSLSCDNNPLTNLKFNTGLIALDCSNTLLTVLDISGNSGCEMLNCQNNPNLNALMIKDAVDIDPDMGDTWSSFDFSNNLNLHYLCVSENRIAAAQTRVNQYGYTGCVVNSYCSFTPGGTYYTINGAAQFDINNDGCDVSDSNIPFIEFTISNEAVYGTFMANASGNYSIPVQAATHLVTPIIENTTYYTISPSSASINFPAQTSPFTQNFCISANGVHNDLETILLPFIGARPGFDAVYKIICKNKGTTVQNASVNLAFDDAVLDFVSASQATTSQTTNNLTWALPNFQPLETRQILATLNVNSPTETPAVNNGDVLNYTASLTGNTDETPSDNSAVLNQTVINSLDPNDKTCLEGSIVSPDMIGQYVHYKIRFENTGTSNAENIVVKDVIDTTKFDITSLVPFDSSHPFVTRVISTNKVEFIFENINLHFDDANNDGYVAFKIKTKPTMVVGDSFNNSANIYFDYNAPIVTNTATTTIQTLGYADFDFNTAFILSPVPAKNSLTISTKQSITISSVNIYNTLGQLIQVNTYPDEIIDVSGLKSGSYFITIMSDRGKSSSKFIKE